MTGPDHYREAERLTKFASDLFDDTSDEAAPREDYATEEEWTAALAYSNEAHEQNVREMGVFAQLAQAHATLALAAATAQQLADRYVGDGDHITAWSHVTKGHDFR